MQLHTLLVVTAGLLLAADNPKEAALKQEMAKLQGTWTIVTAELDGKADATRKNATLTYTSDTFTRKSAAGSVQGKYKLDPAATPKVMDATFTDGPNKGKTLPGIYQLEGDTLKICASQPGKPRPTDWVSKPGSGHLLLVLKREKAVAAPALKPQPKPEPKPAVNPLPDKNLEAAVREVLHEPKEPLTDERLNNVYVLEASGKGIRDLTGLEKCKNLALLRLTNNQVSDLKSLKDLTNLQSLDLAGNKVADVAPLSGLTHLQYLELSNNQVGNVTALKGLTSLSALYLTGNKVSDLSPLEGLTKLSSLSLGHNQIKDISVLSKVTRISTLELKDNQIVDLAPLEKQTELSLLMLERNKITDLAPLVKAAKADAAGPKRFAPYLRLYLAGNPLTEAAKSKQLAELKSYGVRLED